MCAIVDAQVAHEVFGENPSPAGYEFFKWVNEGRGRLVAGGKLLDELEAGSPDFRSWARQAQLSGRITLLDEGQVEQRTSQIERDAKHKSNDPHVLAVAQISGARLLFTNDAALGEDFRDKSLIDRPEGRVYHTRDDRKIKKRHPSYDHRKFRPTHKRLLGNSRLCQKRA